MERVVLSACKQRVTIERVTCMTTVFASLTLTEDPLTCLTVGDADNSFPVIEYSVVLTATENVGTGFWFSWNYGYSSAVEVSTSTIIFTYYDKVFTLEGTRAEAPNVLICREANESFPANAIGLPLVSIQTEGNTSLGCSFGKGPGPLKISTPTLHVNTGDFQTTNVPHLRKHFADLRADLNQRLNAIAGNPPFLRAT